MFASARRGASGDGARSGDGGDRAAAATDTSRAGDGAAPSPSRADGTRKGLGGDRFGASAFPLEDVEVEAARGDAPGTRYAAARGAAARGGALARLAPMPQHPPVGGGGDGGQSSRADPEACENTETEDWPSAGGARGECGGEGGAALRAAALGDATSGAFEAPPGRPEGEPGDASSFVEARGRGSSIGQK